ncbi:MAG: hypothetical protein IIY12_03035 [Clostridia bacterium]|nr:hypothetical protein [Clostridia bacterium]
MMRIEDIDKNLKVDTDIAESDLIWLDAKQAPFSLHGTFYDKNQQCYVRMPQAIADSVSRGISNLNRFPAGGRIRFQTDSSFIGFRFVQKNRDLTPHNTLLGMSGFDLYRSIDGGQETYFKSLIPPMGITEGFSSPVKTDGRMAEYTLNFPIYDTVCEVYIGLKKNARLSASSPYAHAVPILFYGSSITQGGCASRPGNTYQALLSRSLKTDFINLGFSGQGKAEPQMVAYLAERCKNASAFVCNYDWNAPTAEYLEKTHLPLYRTVREKNPNLPILFLSEPQIILDPKAMGPRMEIIRSTYETAKAEGDELVWFLPGDKIYEGAHWDTCTVDGCHPNDLGFYRMAMAMEPYLKEMLHLN